MVDNRPENVSSAADGLFKRLNVTGTFKNWTINWTYSETEMNQNISWDNHEGNNPRTGWKNRARCVYRSGNAN